MDFCFVLRVLNYRWYKVGGLGMIMEYFDSSTPTGLHGTPEMKKAT
jgi:hypothetical protein